ncbi:hypothetical protein [Calothrix sp. CCY 0018]|uniref:hypothetical protein n=1 Tax=Calothrix sp. CCY 0018 TaxID=3103864 RepID=UPI0039C6E47E
MFNKTLGFGLLAAALMVAPGAALANNQSQNSNQQTVQNGTAIDGSVNAQSSESLNVQEQIQKTREKVGRSGGYHGGFGRPSRPSYCGGSYNGQSQNSSQGTAQNGVAVDYSDNAQSGSSVSDQRQTATNSRTCR